MISDHFGMVSESSQNAPKIILKSCQDDAEMMPEPCWNDARSIQELSQDHPKKIINHDFQPTCMMIDRDRSWIAIHHR